MHFENIRQSPSCRRLIVLEMKVSTVGCLLLEDLRALVPVLTFFRLPVTSPVDVGAFP